MIRERFHFPDWSLTLIGLVVSAVLWVSVLTVSGSIHSGFHFLDDHHIVRLDYELRERSLADVLVAELKNDFKIRFRPLYIMERTMVSRILGTDFFAWSLLTGTMAVATTFFLFLFCRLLGFSLIEALIFPLLTLLGRQAAIWWRLGPQESIGMFALSTSLLFLALSVRSEKYKRMHEGLFVACALATTLTKESFILMVPALVFLKMWLEHKKNAKAWMETIRENLLSAFVLLPAAVLELVLIKLYVGTVPIGYAGVQLNAERFLETSKTLAIYGWYWISPAALITAACVHSIRSGINKAIREALNIGWPIAVLFALVVAPQILLYAKSGIYERYLLPGMLGFSLIAIFAIGYLRRGSRSLGLALALTTLIWLLSTGLPTAYRSARNFAQDGYNANAMLDRLATTRRNDPILVVIDPVGNYEFSVSIRRFLELRAGRTNIYYAYVDVDHDSRLKKSRVEALEKYGHKSVDSLGDTGRIAQVVVAPGLEGDFTRTTAWLSRADFKRRRFGGYVVYERRISKANE